MEIDGSTLRQCFFSNLPEADKTYLPENMSQFKVLGLKVTNFSAMFLDLCHFEADG